MIETVHDVEIVTARTVDEVEALRTSWEKADVGNLDAQIDYFLTVATEAGWVVRPHVVRIRRAGRPDLFAIARLEDLPLRVKLGYRTLASPTVRAVVVAFGGLVGATSAHDESLLLTQLHRALDSGEADALVLRHVIEGSTMAVTVPRMASRFRRVHGQPVTRRWIAPLSSSLDDFLSTRSAKSRKKIRAADRKFEREHGDALRLRVFRNEGDIDELCRDLDRVSRLTYQRGLAVGYQGTPFDRAMLRVQLQHGWHRTWMLYLNDAPVAFWTGTAFAGSFATTTPGFDPAWAKDSVGRYTMFKMVEDLTADPAIASLDFGQGEAEYKEAYAMPARAECDEVLLAPRPRPLLLGWSASASNVVNHKARALAEGTVWGARIKKMWRARLAGRATDAPLDGA